MITRKACGLLAALVLLGAGVARAQVPSDPDKAKVLFGDAMRHYNVGEFGPAATKFIEAYKAMPDPTFLYNAAQAYRLGGEHQKALFFYKSYLRDAPDAPNRDEVEKRIEQLKQIQEPPSEAKPPKGTTEPVEPTDPTDPTDPPPGKIDTRVPESAVDTPVVVEQRDGGSKPIYKKWWFWTGVGVVAVGATVAVVLLSGGGGDGTELGDVGPGTRAQTLGVRF